MKKTIEDIAPHDLTPEGWAAAGWTRSVGLVESEDDEDEEIIFKYLIMLRGEKCAWLLDGKGKEVQFTSTAEAMKFAKTNPACQYFGWDVCELEA
jgi:hypothetical protein